MDLYLLMKPDIEWIPDPLRENGGSERERLYRIYESELRQRGASYKMIAGIGEQRVQAGIQAVERLSTYLRFEYSSPSCLAF